MNSIGNPTTGGFLLENQQEFQKVFSENPGNGPPGYERLVYSFTSPGGDAFFAALDPYYLTADDPTPDLGGNIDFHPIKLARGPGGQDQGHP